MHAWCRVAHQRFWKVEERFVDRFGMIEYWVCALCFRRWKISLPAIQTPLDKLRAS